MVLLPIPRRAHPSFVLAKDGQAWFDHGEGIGGNILDLAIRLGELPQDDVAGALGNIERTTGFTGQTIPTIRQPLIQEPTGYVIEATPIHVPGRLDLKGEPTGYVIEATRTMADRRGENWCRSRGLAIEACRPYLVDAYFNRVSKPFKWPLYGVGLPTRTDGVAMRTQIEGGPWVKRNIGNNGITVFEYDHDAPWYEFEGIPDFCTFLTIYQPPISSQNYLILNGTGMTDMAIEFLKEKKPTRLVLCPQNGSKYDYYDRWVHQLRIEAITPDDGRYQHPRCLEGKRACTPEETGGPTVYKHRMEEQRHWAYDWLDTLVERLLAGESPLEDNVPAWYFTHQPERFDRNGAPFEGHQSKISKIVSN